MKPVYIKLRNGRTTQRRQIITDPVVIFEYNEQMAIVGIEIQDYKYIDLNPKKK